MDLIPENQPGLASGIQGFLALVGATLGILATAPALASDLAPRDEAGCYMTYNNLSTSLSAALAALIFGMVFSCISRATFMYVFIISALLFLAVGILFSVKEPQKELDVWIKPEVDQVLDLASG